MAAAVRLTYAAAIASDNQQRQPMAEAHPSMHEIGVSQNAPNSLKLMLASRRFYRVGRVLQLTGGSINIVLALGSPFVLLYRPEWGPLLGAIAGGWLFVSRRALAPFTQRFRLRGAIAQEMFDCAVLGLPWNDALARPIAPEEIASASRRRKKIERLQDWYPTQTAAEWPVSVLVCQRSNAVWARRQHRLYGYVLQIAVYAWAAVGIGVAIVHGASTADYLVTVGLPSLPALLETSELAEGHTNAAGSRERLEERAESLLDQGAATDHDLREIQDQLFTLRRIASIVPEWFYRLVRNRYEKDMKDAATQLPNSSP